MNTIKVIHYIWSANFGGIEKLAIDLTKAQEENPEVKSSILIGCHKGNFIEKLTEENIPHQFAFMKHGFDFRLKPIRKIRAAFREIDIVHIHTFNPVIFLLAILMKKKIVYTIHGNFNFGRKVTLSDRFNHYQRKFCLNHFTDFISFNSKFTMNKAIEKYGLKNVNCKVIYNGIFLSAKNISEIEDAALQNRLKNKFVVGTSSRFAGFKRIDRLIEAYALFVQNKQDTLLLVVGDGPLRDELKSQVSALQISNSTIFTGYQSKVKSYQNQMSICVFPSENEPFGLVAVETLSLGKPTLAFKDGGGMTEILSESLQEDIVDDIPQMAARIEYYYHQFKSGNLKGSDLRVKVASRFEVHTMEKSFFNAYRSV
ncbi:MAG: glycosyltransferase [Bacteroidia bacterium]|nr:glycosyltransferase [Bacteroidia bacterium]